MFNTFSGGHNDFLPASEIKAKKMKDTLFQDFNFADSITTVRPEEYEKHMGKMDRFKYLMNDVFQKFDKSYDLSHEFLPILADIKRFGSSKRFVSGLIDKSWESKSVETVEMFTKLLFEISTFQLSLVHNCLCTKSQIFLQPYPDDKNEEKLKQHEHIVEMVHLINKIYIEKDQKYLEKIFDLFASFTLTSQNINSCQAYLRNFLRFTLYIPNDSKGKVISTVAKLIDCYYAKQVENNPKSNYENFTTLVNEVLTFLEEVYKPLSDVAQEDEQSFMKFFLKWSNLASNLSTDSHFKSVPFFLFYLIAMDYLKQSNKSNKDILLHHVLQNCWQQVSDESLDVEARQASVGYIGSLVVHGNFIPDSCVRQCLRILCFWLHSYLDSSTAAAPRAVFYAVWSAVMYILLNKLKQVLNHPLEFDFFERLDLSRIVNSRLDPLSHCDFRLVARFLELTKFCQLVNYHPPGNWCRSPHQDVLHLPYTHLSPKIQAFYQPSICLEVPIPPDQLELDLMDYIF